MQQHVLKRKGDGYVDLPLNPSTCESEARLVYRMRSTTARDYTKKPCLKKSKGLERERRTHGSSDVTASQGTRRGTPNHEIGGESGFLRASGGGLTVATTGFPTFDLGN